MIRNRFLLWNDADTADSYGNNRDDDRHKKAKTKLSW